MSNEVITTINGVVLYTKEEAANLLDLSLSSVDRYMSLEILKPFQSKRLNRIFFTRKSIAKAALVTKRAAKLLENELKISQ